MYVLVRQSYKKVVQIALRRRNLLVKKSHGESFRKERDLDLCRDSPPRRVTVLSFQVIHLDPGQIPLVPLRPTDHHNHPDQAHRHRVLPLKVE